MVTFQCQLGSSMNANSAELVTSSPFFQTRLNEPELDNPIHCQRFVSHKCTLFFKTFTNCMTMPQIVQLQERNFVKEHRSPNIRRTFTEYQSDKVDDVSGFRLSRSEVISIQQINSFVKIRWKQPLNCEANIPLCGQVMIKILWSFEISCFYLKMNKPVLCSFCWSPRKMFANRAHTLEKLWRLAYKAEPNVIESLKIFRLYVLGMEVQAELTLRILVRGIHDMESFICVIFLFYN